MNAASLPNKTYKLRELGNANKAHLIGISVTCIASQFSDQELAAPGTSLIRNDRKNRNWGWGSRVHTILLGGTSSS
ncbi:unnamed protein product [Schistosoma curassoni]|uniref:Copine domain-containing protein n=1 Tax=Schistosoma curassoni TaxID=6186 RepID=A0A183JBW2_9TREM|nr:unnamed protein product [Schistosoma curassoni]